MRLASKFGGGRWRNAASTAGVFLTLALGIALIHRGPASSRGLQSRVERPSLPAPAAGRLTISATNRHPEVRNYFLDFDGDHSLDAATVIEQPSFGYAKYTVQLHLASGAEQSLVLMAPPGGLQVEMRDMTGDKVPNDVVLRPALLRRFPTVLVNDGHEHFEVAIPATDPGSFSTKEDLGSGRRDSQKFALLTASGFKGVHLPNSRRLFGPQLQECFFPSFTETIPGRLGHVSSSGRAPPLATAN